MLTLYFAKGSSSRASHLVLEEAGADYDACLIDEDAGEQREEDYLRINPRGKVPALRLEDGRILVENVAIQLYVARRFPEANLMPLDPARYAEAVSLMVFFASAVHPAFSHYWAPGRFTDDRSGEDGVRSRGLSTFFDHCREIDQLLAAGWLFGQFTAVDCYAFVFYEWGTRARLPMETLSNYTRHVIDMSARPAVQRVREREVSSTLRRL